MTKQSILLSCILLIGNSIYGQGIVFSDINWNKAIENAKLSDKNIYVNIVSEWCTSCGELKESVFKDDHVSEFYNGHFINLTVDANSNLGRQFIQDYGIRSFPAHVYFYSDGRAVHMAYGKVPPNVFNEIGEAALNPAKQLFVLENKFKSGRDLSVDEYLNYCLATINIRKPDYYACEKFVALLNKDALSNQDVITVISQTLYHSSVASNSFKFFIENQLEISSRIDPNELIKIYNQIAKNTLSLAIKNKGQANYEEYLTTIAKYFPKELALQNDFIYAPRYYLSIGEIDKAFMMVDRSFSHVKLIKNSNIIQKCNDWAWYFYENYNNASQLSAALKWVDYGISINTSYDFIDTKAHLYYKLGRMDEAEELATQVLQYYKSIDKDTTNITALLAKVKIN
ncbi:thioredoxin family protein [Flammeovirga pectinis]|uniref:Thioredoxin family protein n=1 Tax=Flammeovirga pectinis TaxID=2494373 RepID=A0A3S9NZB4_9BACT|nr:thioredoxin family protein [Flammeovirga pectinis]AZQ61274.1 thioredoxin family protein [Flammeovirga pectinis]